MDRAYLKIVEELQHLGLEVRWEIETVKIVMPKVSLLRMLYNKGSTINHLGGVVQNEKKKFVPRVTEKKNSVQGASEKKKL